MNTPGLDQKLRHDRRQRRADLRRRTLESISIVPTLLTLSNLICGFAAIHYATQPFGVTSIFGWTNITVGAALVFLGMFFDAIDGSVARLTRSTSDLGAQLDSLSDVVTFGVAPGFLMLELVEHYYRIDGSASVTAFVGPGVDSLYGKVVWAIAALYVCGAGLRLARFNTDNASPDEKDHREFRGLPTPGAAGAIASLILLQQHLLYTTSAASESVTFARVAALAIPFVALLCAIGMVSNLPYPHMVNRYLRGQRDFGAIVRMVLPIIGAIWFLQETLAIGCTWYALYGPVRGVLRNSKRDAAPPGDPL